MADYYQYVTPTGVILPDTATIIDEINAEWRQAFGQDFVVDPQTTQGAIIAGDVELRDATIRNNVAQANQINPDYAGGVWLDALWSLTAGKRRGATFSRLSGVVLGGQPSTTVPAGTPFTVVNTGAVFLTVAACIIGPGGTVAVDCLAAQSGPVACPAGDLNGVATGVLGLETVTNPTDAVIGKVKESDVASRRRRRQTLALQSVSIVGAIISRLYDTDGVRSLAFRENVSKVDQVIDGIPLVANSIWACVDGGDENDIAIGLLATKTMGAAYNGAIEVSATDPASGQPYEVKFDRPVLVPVFLRVTARYNNTDGANIIPDAVMDYSNGELEGDAGFVVGASVSPFEISGAVNQVEPRIFVAKVEISTDAGTTWSTSELDIALDHMATVTRSSILVVPA